MLSINKKKKLRVINVLLTEDNLIMILRVFFKGLFKPWLLFHLLRLSDEYFQ